ncbi:DUF3644 domain-containing protein [Thermosipho atlanticus]|uniref:DUF3644 domain-containing protein n=1 Tax=Thermosipho atlanticus TaxID=238991 RepID=UPI00389A3BD2
MLQKSSKLVLLPVEVYNKLNTIFHSDRYIVLMIIAWTSLFHIKYFYKKNGNM